MDTFASSPADPAGLPTDSPATIGTALIANTSLNVIAHSMLLLDQDPTKFHQFAVELLAMVDPADSLERVLAEQVILAAERLRRASLLEDKDGIPGADWCRFQTIAERQFRFAQKELRQHREHTQKAAESRARRAAAATEAKSKRAGKAGSVPENAEPSAPPAPPRPESTPEEIADAFSNWRKYIAIIPKLSPAYPVILRTGREVEDVSAWLDAGQTEETMMRWYLELSRADIAACNGCDAEGMCGPFDPGLDPYPPGLPILVDLPEGVIPPRSKPGP